MGRTVARSTCHYRGHAKWLVVTTAVFHGVEQGACIFPGVRGGGVACSDAKYCGCGRVVRVVREFGHHYGGPELDKGFRRGLGAGLGRE